MRVLLDTHVVSALRVRGRHPEVERWAATVPVVDQYLTATVVAELERGVVSRERSDIAQGAVLRAWLEDRVLPAFSGRILPFDLDAARMIATYRVPEHAPYDDALIAAVAQVHSLTVATRNVRHFRPLGVSCLDPWSTSN